MTTIVRAHDVARTDPAHAAALLRAEIAAMQDLLAGLAPHHWRAATDCTGWTVRDVVAHVLGNAEVVLAPDLMELRAREGALRYPQLARLDAMNEMAVDQWRDRPDSHLLAEFGPLWHRVAESVPDLEASVREEVFDTGYPGVAPVKVGYVVDVLLARDLWMHRVDLCRATGRRWTMHEHDRDIIEQVLRDLDDTWTGPPLLLELTGAVTGDWQIGTGPPVGTVRGDALELMRLLSGRAESQPELTLEHGDHAALEAVSHARVPF